MDRKAWHVAVIELQGLRHDWATELNWGCKTREKTSRAASEQGPVSHQSLLSFSHSVVSDCWQPHGLQHARLPCLSLSPRVSSDSCPLSQWCHPNISFSVIPFLLSSILPRIMVFSSESALCIRWPKYWSFSFSTSPSNEYSGLISYRMDWFDLLAVQGTLKSLLQHHSSKASILWCSAFFMVQLSLLYMTAGKTIALTIQTFVSKVMSLLFNVLTFVSKVMSLLFNVLSRLVIAFLPRSKCLLILWMQSLSAVIFGSQENKTCHCFHYFPIYLPWSNRPRCHELSFSNAGF